MGASFGSLSAVVSILGATLSVVATALSLYRSARNQQSKLEKARERELEEILASSDLDIVGGYLDDVIGRFNVYEYVTADGVATSVDRYLGKLRSFVSTDAHIARAAQPVGEAPEVVEPSGLSEELERSLLDVRTGEVWNGLARLRRHIEMRLRSFAAEVDVSVKATSSAGQLVRALWHAKVISGDAYDNLGYVVALCNEAVHGGEVGRAIAEEAVVLAAAALTRLDWPLGPEG